MFYDELDRLRQYFCRNGYGLRLIDDVFRKCIDDFVGAHAAKIITVPCCPVVLAIPYLCQSSFSVGRRLRIAIAVYAEAYSCYCCTLTLRRTCVYFY